MIEGEEESLFPDTEELIPLDDELPPVVWLAGDEPFFEDFILDAEAAMRYLGIKRSRLTQISGRELRVGKVRADRYTRAVYRAQDLERYRSWTRRTAAHQRSAEVVRDATSKIDSLREDLVQILSSAVAALGQDLNAGLRQVGQGLVDRQAVPAQGGQRVLQGLRELLVLLYNESLAQKRTHTLDQATTERRLIGLDDRAALFHENLLGRILEAEDLSRRILGAQAQDRADQEDMRTSVSALSALRREDQLRLGHCEAELRRGVDALARLESLLVEALRPKAPIIPPTVQESPRRPARRVPVIQRQRLVRHGSTC